MKRELVVLACSALAALIGAVPAARADAFADIGQFKAALDRKILEDVAKRNGELQKQETELMKSAIETFVSPKADPETDQNAKLAAVNALAALPVAALAGDTEELQLMRSSGYPQVDAKVSALLLRIKAVQTGKLADSNAVVESHADREISELAGKAQTERPAPALCAPDTVSQLVAAAKVTLARLKSERDAMDGQLKNPWLQRAQLIDRMLERATTAFGGRSDGGDGDADAAFIQDLRKLRPLLLGYTLTFDSNMRMRREPARVAAAGPNPLRPNADGFMPDWQKNALEEATEMAKLVRALDDKIVAENILPPVAAAGDYSHEEAAILEGRRLATKTMTWPLFLLDDNYAPKLASEFSSCASRVAAVDAEAGAAIKDPTVAAWNSVIDGYQQIRKDENLLRGLSELK